MMDKFQGLFEDISIKIIINSLQIYMKVLYFQALEEKKIPASFSPVETTPSSQRAVCGKTFQWTFI
jgi:hypothetical protein